MQAASAEVNSLWKLITSTNESMNPNARSSTDIFYQYFPQSLPRLEALVTPPTGPSNTTVLSMTVHLSATVMRKWHYQWEDEDGMYGCLQIFKSDKRTFEKLFKVIKIKWHTEILNAQPFSPLPGISILKRKTFTPYFNLRSSRILTVWGLHSWWFSSRSEGKAGPSVSISGTNAHL